MTTQELDQTKVEAFVGRALGDLSATNVVAMCAIGDRLGLFKDLSADGPASSGELAERTGLQERYLREWLSALASAGYLAYDPTSRRFSLPPAHAPVLAEEGGPVFFGGAYQMTLPMLAPIEGVIDAFRTGGGVPQAAYGETFWDGFERFSGGWFQNLLIPVWIPAVPDVQAKLERGALVADVGCGRGRALIALAQAFPNSRYVGYDAYAPTIARATANAEAAGVADRVRFEERDASKGLPDQYDVITTFDVVHDAVNPRGLLKAIRQGLKPDGIYLTLEVNCGDTVEANAGPLGAFFYSASVLYCMTTSLSQGGEGLGTAGLPESKVRELCAEAGFGSVRRVPLENPFNSLFEVKP
jgi:SAM-dependent methyltransferase